MEPIKTKYNGHLFRSRLEARWAVFLDALHVSYEYEPEGYVLDNGMWYLPDFRVKCWGFRGDRDGPPFDLFIEVKGEMRPDDEQKIRAFCGLDPNGGKDPKKPPLLIVHKIPPHGIDSNSDFFESYSRMPGSELYPFNYESIDGDHFAAYPAATKSGRFYLFGDDSSYVNMEDIPQVRCAYDRARMAQFEYQD